MTLQSKAKWLVFAAVLVLGGVGLVSYLYADNSNSRATNTKTKPHAAKTKANKPPKPSTSTSKKAAPMPPQPISLTDPAHANELAPDNFTVVFETTAGTINIDVHRDWAPVGVDRFYNLINAGFYNDVAFFRVLTGFVAQFGLHGDPKINNVWRSARIEDDPVKHSNTRGTLSFATAGPGTRTTQIFINFGNNARLDDMGFSAFAEVQAESMPVLDKLYAGYGEGAPQGQGPSQARIQSEGNSYLKSQFPKLDFIKTASIKK